MDLPYRTPFDWDGLLRWLAARAIHGVESVSDGMYVRGGVCVRNEGAHLTTTAEPERVHRLFDLGADPTVIAAVLSRDRMLAPLVIARPGVRVPGAWDPFELAVRAIVGQQVSVAGARTVLGRIAEQHTLTPERLAVETVTGMPQKRAETIRLLAREVVSGSVVLGRSDLTRLAGIGPWTASYIAMRLGDPDAFPAGDLILRRNAGNSTERELLRRAERWRPFRAYAAMLLWMR